MIQENKQEKSPIKQNILLYLEKKGITKYEFYKQTGVTRGVLGQNNGISEDNLSRFLAYYKDVNIEWLLTGKGSMLKDNSKNFITTEMVNLKPIEETNYAPSAIHSIDTPNVGIPLIPIDAMAGALSGDISVLEYECERYVIPMFKGADFLINVKGLSMQPKYNSGDIVACKRIPMSDLFFQWNKVYVIDTNQGALIKRIKKGSNQEHVLIVSDNKDYEPFELPISAIYSVAIVMGVIRLE